MACTFRVIALMDGVVFNVYKVKIAGLEDCYNACC